MLERIFIKMEKTLTVGKKAENKAAHYLIEQGYEILERNYRFKKTEIDIIVRKDNLLVFVEVKARSSNSYGHPEDFLQSDQEERIREGATNYQEKIGWNKAIRFDIFAVEFIRTQGFNITHIEDAF